MSGYFPKLKSHTSAAAILFNLWGRSITFSICDPRSDVKSVHCWHAEFNKLIMELAPTKCAVSRQFD